jgi:hypothetical protein
LDIKRKVANSQAVLEFTSGYISGKGSIKLKQHKGGFILTQKQGQNGGVAFLT